jgi:hypothetical protein
MKKLAIVGMLAFTALTANSAAPAGWIVAGSAPKDYEFNTDLTQSTEGRKSAYIKGKSSAAETGFGTLMQMFAADEYRGGRWKLTARMRTLDAHKAQLWMRVDGPNQKMNGFDNMDDRPISGSSEWTRYEIVLDVPEDSVAVAFGFFLSGTGEVWADEFKLERVTGATPLTGRMQKQERPRGPTNLDFED